jgi:8-oxo-dGTP pyrophosphatase MutT (NUDIX family)
MSAHPPPAIPVPAATLLLVRDGPTGLEVFMVKRHHKIDFMPGAMVFPGGKLDPGDSDPALRPLCAGVDGVSDENLAMRIGAIREAFEECGVLLARAKGDHAVVDAERLSELEARYRDALQDESVSLTEMVTNENLELACDLLVHFAHWITPERVPRRYDTHFFLVAAPPDHVAAHDGTESVDSIWISPADAIEEEKAGRRTIIFPTMLNLMKLGRSKRSDDAVAAAQAGSVVPVLPTMAKRDGAMLVQIPADADYGVTEYPVDAMRPVPSGGTRRPEPESQ